MVWRLVATLLVFFGFTGAAFAQCTTLPNTLTNGTNADASQVMANFTGIVNCPLFNGVLGVAGTPGSPATSGTTQNGELRVGSAGTGGGNGLDVGVLASAPYATWMQAGFLGDYSLHAYYPISLNPLGGNVTVNVPVGAPSPSSAFYVNGTAGGTNAWSNFSDLRLKKDIAPLTGALDLVQQLRGVRYQWREPNEREIGRDLRLAVGRPQVGFIAQEVEAVLPQMVDRPEQAGATWGLRETALLPVLVEAIKEQQRQIDDLRKEIKALTTPKEGSASTASVRVQ
jgi:hypothetical protein